jgi:hypothetical protein
MDSVGPMRVGIHPVSFNVNVSVAVSVSVFTCDQKLIFYMDDDHSNLFDGFHVR